jgi:hypothetical protein
LRLLFPTIPLPIPALEAATKAPWPVWSGSTTSPVRFAPMPKKAAVRLWHRARDFDRGTHQPGRHGGAVGPTALAVLHALIFDFLNFRLGRLDPSYAAIARASGVCVRTVATALQRLRELGILAWIRRCAESWRDGRFVLEQETNAYAVLPESQWRGYRPPAEPPAPAPGPGAIHRPYRLCSPRRRWKGGKGASCERWCRSSPPIPRTVSRPHWHGSGGRSWRATREFYRSARDAEKHSPDSTRLTQHALIHQKPATAKKKPLLNKSGGRAGAPLSKDSASGRLPERAADRFSRWPRHCRAMHSPVLMRHSSTSIALPHLDTTMESSA